MKIFRIAALGFMVALPFLGTACVYPEDYGYGYHNGPSYWQCDRHYKQSVNKEYHHKDCGCKGKHGEHKMGDYDDHEDRD